MALRNVAFIIIFILLATPSEAIVQSRSINSVIKFNSRFSSTASLNKPVTTGLPLSQEPQLVYFSGAGLYFWWQLGVAKYLQDHCEENFLRRVPVAAASAGCITTTLLLTNANLDTLPELALEVAEEAGVLSGDVALQGKAGELLRKWLHRALPERAITPELFGNVQISVCPKLGRPKLVSGFSNKDELIEAIMASCHVPLFIDGKVYAEFAGEKVVDGAFWYFLTKRRNMGLPVPPQTPRDQIFWIDHLDDQVFKQSVGSNFLTFVGREGINEMIDYGYNFMKQKHYSGNLPFVKQHRLLFVSKPKDIRIPFKTDLFLNPKFHSITFSDNGSGSDVSEEAFLENVTAAERDGLLPRTLRMPWRRRIISENAVIENLHNETSVSSSMEESNKREGIFNVAQQVTRYLAPMGRFGSVYEFESMDSTSSMKKQIHIKQQRSTLNSKKDHQQSMQINYLKRITSRVQSRRPKLEASLENTEELNIDQKKHIRWRRFRIPKVNRWRNRTTSS